MGRFDTSSIEGFDSMSAEEKVSALLGANIPDTVDLSNFVEKSKYEKLKSANDKNSSDVASLKKQLSERMTDEEKQRSEAETSRQELEEKYNALLKETTMAKYVSKFIAQGYDADLAQKTAEAWVSGDMDKVFECGDKYRESLTKSLKSAALKDTPRPLAGEGDSVEKMSDDVRVGINIGKTNAAVNKLTSDVLSKYL